MSIPVQRVQPNFTIKCYWKSFIRLCPISNWEWPVHGNVIGGGDWAKDRIIVDCVKAFFKE